ncbi:MAG TPA: FAD-binding protein [Gemmatimonadales bacterium]
MTTTREMSPAHPASMGDVQSAVREAAAASRRLRIVGRGGWLQAGRPVQADGALDVSALSGVVEYVPGDLTLTALAGTTLAELRAVARAEGQWLPLDPWGGDDGTLGATLATATAGPSSGALGLPRDLVLGVAFVTGTGELVRGGGRVVKNVAGFDLVRLTVGAWGTLGVITEATVRLRALPEVELTLALAAPGDPRALGEWLARLRRLALVPVALELVNGALAARLGVGDASTLLVRLAGNEAAVAAQRAALAGHGDVAVVRDVVWDDLRVAEPGNAAVVRLSSRPAALAVCAAEAVRIASSLDEPALAHASVARGVVRMMLPTTSTETLASALGAPPVGMSRILERLPAALWPRLAPSAVGDRLSPLVRRAFDPHHLLNPGILGGEEGEGAHLAAGTGEGVKS